MNVCFILQCPARDDEGSVRQLRGPEDDRCERADAAQDPHAQDSAAPQLAAQVYLRKAHNRQAGEVLHEGARIHQLYRRGARPHRPAPTHQWSPLNTPYIFF